MQLVEMEGMEEVVDMESARSFWKQFPWRIILF